MKSNNITLPLVCQNREVQNSHVNQVAAVAAATEEKAQQSRKKTFEFNALDIQSFDCGF